MTEQRLNPAAFPTPKVGDMVTFYCEIQQEYESPGQRLRRFTGRQVMVIEALGAPDPDYPKEGSTQFKVRAGDGTEFTAQQEEIDGWDLALGQYFWPDGTYGPNHDRTFLVNEKN